jgi:hypothetical protein
MRHTELPLRCAAFSGYTSCEWDSRPQRWFEGLAGQISRGGEHDNRKRIAAMLGVSLVSTHVVAAPVTLPQTLPNGFSSTDWQIANSGGTTTGFPYTGTCGGVGVTIQDATGPAGSGDAFDNANEIFVNDTVLAQTSGDLTGTTLTMNPVTISGLSVTLQYFAVPGVALLRTLVTLHNPTGSPIAAKVDVPVNFGSDSGTIIRATSSGDTNITTADRCDLVRRWTERPRQHNGNVLDQRDGAADPYTQTVFNCAATNGLGGTFNLTVPAGASLSLVFFAGLGGITTNSNTVAAALAGAQAIFDTPNGLTNAGGFAGLTSQQLSSLEQGAGVDVISYNPTLQHLYVPSASTGTMGILDVAADGTLSLLGMADTAKDAHCVVADEQGNAWVCDPDHGQILLVKDSFPPDTEVTPTVQK